MTVIFTKWKENKESQTRGREEGKWLLLCLSFLTFSLLCHSPSLPDCAFFKSFFLQRFHPLSFLWDFNGRRKRQTENRVKRVRGRVTRREIEEWRGRGRGKTDWILLLFIICWRTWHLLWKWERVTEQKKEGKTSYSTDKEAVVRKLASLTHRNIWLKGVLMHYSTKGKYILTGPKVHNTTHFCL